MYKVVREFVDLQDNDHLYQKGDIYPREGGKIDKERVIVLSTTGNKIGEILIEEVVETATGEEKENNKVDLDTLTVSDLKILCDEKGITYLAKVTKQELITFLEDGE